MSHLTLREVGFSGFGGTGNGLLGQYFSDKNFATLKLTRLDPTINFDWAAGSPAADMPTGKQDFSIRWTGYIEPRYSETYTFKTYADDSIRVWVGGVKIIDRWTWKTGYTGDTGNIPLVAGSQYAVKIEYANTAYAAGLASMKLYWKSASQAEEIVPTDFLYPDLAGAKTSTTATGSTATGVTGAVESVWQKVTSVNPLYYGAAAAAIGLGIIAYFKFGRKRR